jgi:S-adenosylhomocysteine hydrolase
MVRENPVREKDGMRREKDVMMRKKNMVVRGHGRMWRIC